MANRVGHGHICDWRRLNGLYRGQTGVADARLDEAAHAPGRPLTTSTGAALTFLFFRSLFPQYADFLLAWNGLLLPGLIYIFRRFT